MKLRSNIDSWKYLPCGEDMVYQFVVQKDAGRLKYTENPESPVSEFKESIKTFKKFSMICLPPCSEQVLIEAQKRFDKVLVVDYNFERLSQLTVPNINYLIVKDENEFRAKLNAYSKHLDFGKVISYIPKRYAKIDPQINYLLSDVLIEVQKEFCSFAANRSLKKWHRNLNTIKNIQNLQKVIIPLPDLEKKDALIVGAGPSLDDTVDKIKKYRKHYTIIATDGSLKTLMKNGVCPEIIVSCEDSLLSWQFFKSHLGLLKESTLFAPYNSNHYLLKNFPGKLCLTKQSGEDWPDTFLSALTLVNIGRCVGHYAFNLAKELNAGRIIMTGFDLSFKGSVFHPKDMPVPYFHEMDLPVPVTVESIFGDELLTDLSMLTYLRDFENLIEQTDIEVIDATEAGALKKGSIISNFEDIKFQRRKKELRFTEEEFNLKKSFYKNIQNSSQFKAEVYESFTSYLVQNSDSEIDKTEDLKASYSLARVLIQDCESNSFNKTAIVSNITGDAQELKTLLDLPDNILVIPNESLSQTLQKVREEKIGNIYCINGLIPPDLIALESCKCIDVRLNRNCSDFERNLWLENYEVICLESDYGFWRKFYPENVKLSASKKELLIQKVS